MVLAIQPLTGPVRGESAAQFALNHARRHYLGALKNAAEHGAPAADLAAEIDQTATAARQIVAFCLPIGG